MEGCKHYNLEIPDTQDKSLKEKGYFIAKDANLKM